MRAWMAIAAVALGVMLLPADGRADVGAAVRQHRCQDLEQTVRAQPWQEDGAPFGKLYRSWSKADFDAVLAYSDECWQSSLRRGISILTAGEPHDRITNFLASHQSTLALAAAKKRDDERRVAMDKDNAARTAARLEPRA